MGEAKSREWYDEAWKRAGLYEGPTETLPWFPIWSRVAEIAKSLRMPYLPNALDDSEPVRDPPMRSLDRLRVADLGCGQGHLAQMIAPLAHKYLCVDFSSEALSRAAERISNVDGASFVLADLTSYVLPEADLFIACEVLEHLPDGEPDEDGDETPGADVELIRSCYRDHPSYLIATLPKRDSESHARFFPRAIDVERRYASSFYGQVFAIEECGEWWILHGRTS